MPKRPIRAQFLAERKALAKDRRAELSKQIQKKFLASKLFAEVKFLGLYCAVHNEVSTDMVCSSALAAGKRVAYPRVAGENLEFVEVASLDELLPGSFTVPEPAAGDRVLLDILDLVVVPGIVFDLAGHRLGYGRGYYDRALDECRPDCATVGFAYDFQVVDTLSIMQEHDRTLSVLMTEQRTLNFITR